MLALNFKKYKKNTLFGFFDLQPGSGLLICGMSYHVQNGKRWVSFPSKPYQDEGETKYQSITKIPDETR